MSDLDLRAVRGAKDARRVALGRALLGVAPEPEQEAGPPKTPGFDGGARQPAPLPAPSHGETLIAILNSRAGDVGGGEWFW